MIMLRHIIPLILKKLQIEALFEVVVEVLTDVLTSFPAFLEAQHFASLAAALSDERAHKWVLLLRSGEFEEDAQDFSRLLFAYGDAAVQDLTKNTEDSAQAQVLYQLVQLVNCAGYEGSAVQVCSQAVEFWATFTEYATDEIFTDEEDVSKWMDSAKRHVISALEQGWARIRLPSPEVIATWDAETRTDFKTLRRDLQDLVQASFTLLEMPIFETFAGLAVTSLHRQAWPDVEASLFCLNALSDATVANTAVDESLSNIFQSQLYTTSSTTSPIPLQTQQTALEFLEKYALFFERQYRYLPDLLTYLFQCLDHTNLAHLAAKAIKSICDSCSERLTSEVGSFLNAYASLQEKDSEIKEKVIGAIAMVIRQMPESEVQMEPLSKLLAFVEMDATNIGQKIAIGDMDTALVMGLCALRCLASMSKALQLPDGILIDLEASSETNSLQPNVWALSAGRELQSRIIHLLQAITSSLSADSDIVEVTCQVLRNGYKEYEPGLFVLPPSVTVELVEFGFRSNFGSPRLNFLLDSASVMLSRRNYAPKNAMQLASSRLLQLIIIFLEAQNSKPPYSKTIPICGGSNNQ